MRTSSPSDLELSPCYIRAVLAEGVLDGDLPAAIDRAFASNRPALLNVDIQRAISPRAQAAIARWTATTYQPF